MRTPPDRLIDDLIATETAVVRALDAIAQALRGGPGAARVTALHSEHADRLEALGALSQSLGGAALDASTPEPVPALARDRPLAALRDVEWKASEAYERALELDDVPDDVRAVLSRALDEERGHEQVVLELLGTDEVPQT